MNTEAYLKRINYSGPLNPQNRRDEQDLSSKEEYEQILRDQFGIVMSHG